MTGSIAPAFSFTYTGRLIWWSEDDRCDSVAMHSSDRTFGVTVYDHSGRSVRPAHLHCNWFPIQTRYLDLWWVQFIGPITDLLETSLVSRWSKRLKMLTFCDHSIICLVLQPHHIWENFCFPISVLHSRLLSRVRFSCDTFGGEHEIGTDMVRTIPLWIAKALPKLLFQNAIIDNKRKTRYCNFSHLDHECPVIRMPSHGNHLKAYHVCLSHLNMSEVGSAWLVHERIAG